VLGKSEIQEEARHLDLKALENLKQTKASHFLIKADKNKAQTSRVIAQNYKDTNLVSTSRPICNFKQPKFHSVNDEGIQVQNNPPSVTEPESS
jgi:type IV secretory pathway VirB6-like protein